MELSKLNPGDAVVTGQIFGREERFLRIRKVAKVTLTGRQPQVVLDNGDRYKIETGFGFSGLADPILRLATQADFDREQAQRRKSEESRNQINADEAHRKELADLFPAVMRPGISGASSNQPGYFNFNLEFYNVPEEDIGGAIEVFRTELGAPFLEFNDGVNGPANQHCLRDARAVGDFLECIGLGVMDWTAVCGAGGGTFRSRRLVRGHCTLPSGVFVPRPCPLRVVP